MLTLLGLITAAATAVAVPLEQQQPLAPVDKLMPHLNLNTPGASTEAQPQPLTGRFLHITDFHPDRYYKAGSSPDKGSCHHGQGEAGYFGQEGSDCDSPLVLVDETFRWIKDNIKDEIDFVIWTGDSARHDNDENIPRDQDEILEINRYMSQKWVDLFGTSNSPDRSAGRLSVPVVPTFGNNDILPHNIFRGGPNAWTKKFNEIWVDFIPEDQRHSFVQGGWFTSEVIPGKLAVISLNTMYFFESNSAVDGCKDRSEPGYEHMEWLRVQLQILRERGMKAILMGHVAPARSDEKTNWDETCWQKYTVWMDRYRDVVVASLYGHMNVDHFVLQDSHAADAGELSEKQSDGTVSAMSKSDYLVSLRGQWSDLPSVPAGLENVQKMEDFFEANKKKGKEDKEEKKIRKYLKKIGGPWAERYSVSLVSPSLVPNFFPTLRMVEYNLTGLENVGQTDEHAKEEEKKGKGNGKGKGKKKPSFKAPKPPSSTAPPGPAYSNQALTLLGYTQYYANLTRLNEEATQSKKSPRLEFEVEYTTSDDVYEMSDLTVRSFLELATRIGEAGEVSSQKKGKVNAVWRAFLERAFTGYMDVEELEESF
ncbi:Endopolyphosphatase [Penicillium waksmanii]|uniref:Endopolyphosphatase n=1 Tax=Penicillium waksmanii TaxID=69791 RepID=UPI002546667C|nr:Endopolyphosphatase [Penicillium waksmanii]KAJ5975575.1 Endopolyphosphatase [Penicillium waksmanii]